MRANAVRSTGVVDIAADIGLIGDIANLVIAIVAGGVDCAAGRRGAGNTVQGVVTVDFDQVVVGIQPSEFLRSSVTKKRDVKI
jgi:hypothetical protein